MKYYFNSNGGQLSAMEVMRCLGMENFFPFSRTRGERDVQPLSSIFSADVDRNL